MKRLFIVAASLLALTACDQMKNGGGASGPTQEVKIVTIPSDANCAVDKNNVTVDRFNGTPLTARIPTGDNVVVRCIKSGYKQGSATVRSGDKSVTMTLTKKK